MLYKIGDVSKMLGISPDLLRYYEKKGVVKPQKDNNNDYRYYEAWDINFLIECLWFKEFQFGIKEISKMVSQYSYGELQATLAHRCESIRREIEQQKMLLDRLEQYRESLERAERHIHKCDIQNSPEMLRYLNRYNFIYDDSPDVQRLGKQWIKHIPYIRRCFDINIEEISRGGTDFAWGFYMEMEYAGRLNVEAAPPVVHLPSQKSIHSVFKQPGKYNFSPKLLRYMLDYAKENGLEICGHARGQLLCSVVEDGESTGYFEAWIPVK